MRGLGDRLTFVQLTGQKRPYYGFIALPRRSLRNGSTVLGTELGTFETTSTKPVCLETDVWSRGRRAFIYIRLCLLAGALLDGLAGPREPVADHWEAAKQLQQSH